MLIPFDSASSNTHTFSGCGNQTNTQAPPPKIWNILVPSDREFHGDHEYTPCWGSMTIRAPPRGGQKLKKSKFLVQNFQKFWHKKRFFLDVSCDFKGKIFFFSEKKFLDLKIFRKNFVDEKFFPKKKFF